MKFTEADHSHNSNSILKEEENEPWNMEPIKDIIM